MSQSEIAELERVIAHLDTLYEAGDPCIHPDTDKPVADSEYDALRSRLKHLHPTSFIFETPTASTLQIAGKKLVHKPPMTSINKANGSLTEKTKILEDWRRAVVDELGYKTPMSTWGSKAYKLDGAAMSIIYEDGLFVAAGLRPRDGINGQDVSDLATRIDGIPAKLGRSYSFVVRGEVICHRSVFKRINEARQKAGEKLYANPRNYAAGSLGLDDPDEFEKRELVFIAYNIIWTKGTPPYKTEVERARWVNLDNKGMGLRFVQVRPFDNHDSLKEMEDHAPSLDYETDGVVISVNNLEDQEQMGTHGGSPNGNPKGKIAWKFEEEHAHCSLKSITWATGRTSKIVPVANFDAVQLAGTMVTSPTLHSLGFMRRNQIGIGTVLQVIKSGKIIPFVQKAVAHLVKDPPYPKKCPTCDAPTVVEDINKPWNDEKYTAELYCTNPLCPASAVNTLLHYLTTMGVKGIGDSAMETLYNKELVQQPSDFYSLSKKDLMEAGFSEREAILNDARIWMLDKPEKNKDDDDLVKQTEAAKKDRLKFPLWQVFASLGIHGAGKSVGRALQDTFHTMTGIMGANKTELMAVDGIGEITADTILDYFKTNTDAVMSLLKYITPEGPKTGKLSGKTFVFTGGFSGGKDAWEKKVTDLGAKTSSSVSKKTDFVVVGTDAGSKLVKAQQLGVKTLTPQELEKML